MLDFKIKRDNKTNSLYIETNIASQFLLAIPQLNKGTAFTYQERLDFGLLGKIPNRIETLEEQVERAYMQYLGQTDLLQQFIYLHSLHSKNQILFYKLVSTHLNEMLPIIYTPIVGKAVKAFSREYRHPRGLYISHPYQQHIDEILNNRTNPEIDIIVVTDGEAVLGIGDQGIGGMDIPVAKLMVYSLCGGIDPARTLPIFLDLGTNNKDLLNDKLYLGWQHPRVNEDSYDAFIESFVSSIKRHFPNAFLHWEDLGRNNAKRILEKYQDQICTFNDDIQGTGAVTLAGLLSACNITKNPLENNKIVVFGAGSAGTGISEQLHYAMQTTGLSADEAYKRFWLIDKQGLLLDDDPNLTPAQKPFARSRAEFERNYSLLEVINLIKPNILIGSSAQAQAFTKEIIEAMSLHNEHPIIFPLSNPDYLCEAQPQDILTWSKGKALIAAGTIFPTAVYNNEEREITQCNNALIFPGIGLGVIAVKAKRLTKTMILAAAQTLSKFAPNSNDYKLPLLPPLSDAPKVAKKIAIAVAEAAINEGLAQCNQEENLENVVAQLFWQPKYLPFRKV